MQKPLVSLSVLVLVLQACSGKAGFQGGSAVAPISEQSSGDAAAQQGNRDAESGDAMGIPSGSNADEMDGTGIDSQVIESENSELQAMGINEGSDATVSIPLSTPAGNSTNTPNTSTNTTNTAQGAMLSITVPSTQIRSGSTSMQATAKLSTQATAPAVQWSVKSSGAQSAGSISETGLYTPPASGGGYDIVITAVLSDDPSITASITIKVIAQEQIFVGCVQGTEQFPITADVYQLPTNTNKLPDFSKITKLTKVCMDQYNVAARNWTSGFPGVSGLFEWFALRTTTNLVIPTGGSYALKLNSDDGAKLYIDGNLVINNDGLHAPAWVETTLNLTAGTHTLMLDYFQGPREQIALELFWKVPGSTAYVYVPKSSFK